MRALIFLGFTFLLPFSIVFGQSSSGSKWFEKGGKEIGFKKLVKLAGKADVVLFGELHNNEEAHRAQLELLEELNRQVKNKALVLGMEMLEADNQILVEEYFAGLIEERNFEDEVRLWGNYETDYKPCVNFALNNGLELVATNIPRRYAASVMHNGIEVLDKLSDEAKTWIAPLPIEVDLNLPAYAAMIEMMGGHEGENGENFPKAQAVKDATMAHFINDYCDKGKLVYHLNGNYHSDNFEGINWYLKQYAPKLKVLTISTVLQENGERLKEENSGLADFLFLTWPVEKIENENE